MSMKETYQQKLQAQLDEWNAEIEKLKAKSDKAEADIKLEYYEEIEDLRVRQEAAREKLTTLKNASDDAWQDLKAGIDDAWHTLGEAVQKAVARFT